MIRSRTRSRRGVAMVLVLGVVGVAAVMGYAMLASASLQRQASTNAAAAIGAQAMAESGANLAIYYLNAPERWTGYPATYPQTEDYDRAGQFWTGTGGQFVSFGSPAVGSVKVSVVRPDPAVRWRYAIESIGRAPGSTVERRVNATVWVNAEYKITQAAMFTNDVTLPAAARIGQMGENSGDVYSNGALTIRSGGIVYGTGTRRKVTFSAATPTGGWRNPVPVVPSVVPRNLTEIRSYLTYEMPAGTPRIAVVITDAAIGNGQPVRKLEVSPSNPAGIFYAPGNLRLTTDADIRGTLIVNGNLSIDGTNVRVRRVADGFPALLVNGNTSFTNVPGCNLNVEGLMWVRGSIDSLAVMPTLDVTGSLMAAGTTPIYPLTLNGRINVVYDSTRTRIVDFSDIGRTPTSVRILSWRAQ